MQKKPSPMQFIWDHQAKPGPDGTKYIRYSNNGELLYLYRTGFVDVDKFPMEEWIKAFTSSRKSDGSFWVTEAQWLEKEKYLYRGPVGDPLDPSILQEGIWKEADFENLLKTRVFPAIDVDEKSFRSLLPTQGVKLVKAGEISLTPTFKTFLKTLITDRPSPQQCRAAYKKAAQSKTNPQGIQPSPASPPTQKTSFSMGPSSAQQTQNEFSKLLLKK